MKELKIFKTTPNFHDSFFKGPPLYLNYENNIFGSYKKQFKESCSYKYFQFPKLEYNNNITTKSFMVRFNDQKSKYTSEVYIKFLMYILLLLYLDIIFINIYSFLNTHY